MSAPAGREFTLSPSPQPEDDWRGFDEAYAAMRATPRQPSSSDSLDEVSDPEAVEESNDDPDAPREADAFSQRANSAVPFSVPSADVRAAFWVDNGLMTVTPDAVTWSPRHLQSRPAEPDALGTPDVVAVPLAVVRRVRVCENRRVRTVHVDAAGAPNAIVVPWAPKDGGADAEEAVREIMRFVHAYARGAPAAVNRDD